MTPEERARKALNEYCLHPTRPLIDIVADAIRDAVTEEREACALVAALSMDVYNIGNCIARDIHNRGGKKYALVENLSTLAGECDCGTPRARVIEVTPAESWSIQPTIYEAAAE